MQSAPAVPSAPGPHGVPGTGQQGPTPSAPRGLVESLAGPVYACDVDGRITFYNDAAAELWGRRPEPEVDRWSGARRLFSPDGQALVADRCPMALAIRDGVPIRGQHIVIERPDGVRLHVKANPQPLFDDAGTLTGAVDLLNPLDTPAAQPSAADSQHRLARAALDSLTSRVCVLDEHGIVVSVNQAWRLYESLRPGEATPLLEGSDFLGACEASKAAGMPGASRLADGLRAVLNGKLDRHEGELATNRSPDPQWFMVRVSRMAWQGPRRVVVTLIDVTARVRAERAMKESSQRWQFAIEGNGDGLWDTDLSNSRTMYSARWCEMLGIDPSSIGPGADEWVTRLHEDDWERALASYQACLDGDAPQFHCELRLQCSDGGWQWFLARGMVVSRALDGSPTRFIGTCSDISQRKDDETVRLALEVQLVEAQKMEAVGLLASSIAHDFNNLIGAIHGNAELMRLELAEGHPSHDRLDQIRKASQRARSLVHKVLSFSRRDPPSISLQPVTDVVAESIDLLRATLPSTVRLSTRLCAETLAVQMDASQISQMLLNLGTNAWQALQGLQGEIEIGLDRVDVDATTARAGLPPGRYAHVWVRDNGCGMDESAQARIFDPFYTTKPAGTGLGMAVVARIVQAHGGHLTIDSEAGQGCRVHVHLPAQILPPPKSAFVEVAAPSVAEIADGQRVMFIDDDEIVSLLAEQVLTRAGFRVTCEPDAARALETIRARPEAFDAVVSDHQMPGLSGLDVTRQIQSMQPRLPVIIASGSVTDELASQAQRAGAAGLVAKERLFEDLAQEILRALTSPPLAPAGAD